VRDAAPIPRKEVSRLSKLSIATTKRLIEELLWDRFIVEVGVSANTRGRKASLLELNEDHVSSIGVNILPNALEIIGVSFKGTKFYSNRVDSVRAECNTILSLLKKELKRALDETRKSYHDNILGIGVGIAGLVNIHQGIVLYTPNMYGWENVELASILKKEFKTAVIIDDSVRCMALSEKRYGIGRDLQNFLYIYIGKGVGSGVLLDGRLYRGAHGAGGEFGHITIKQEGKLCNCGNRGCLEAYVSESRIIDEVRNSASSNGGSSLARLIEDDNSISLKDIIREADNDDRFANLTINNVGENIGIGIANLVNVFDPGVVILGGEIIGTFGERVIQNVMRIVSLKSIRTISSQTSIVQGSVTELSASRGAATMLIEKYLQNNILNI
jgi:predicted NBD/HSP70 family sugar kinase